ncbi:hypothetical protein MMC32_007087 [Xylographa parallela]|nr:hypothetical protein [Xylographa parallela]
MRASFLIAPLLLLGGVAAYAYPSEYDTFDNSLSYLARRSPGAAGSKAAKAAGKVIKESKDTGYKFAAGGGTVLAEEKYNQRKGGSGGGSGSGTGGTGGAEDKKAGAKPVIAKDHSHISTDNVVDKTQHHSKRSLLTPEEEHYFLVARHAEALDELEDLYYY